MKTPPGYLRTEPKNEKSVALKGGPFWIIVGIPWVIGVIWIAAAILRAAS